MLIVIVGLLTISRMPTDIFPDIDIPVISVVFNYSGLSPEDVENGWSTIRAVPDSGVNDIEHREPVLTASRWSRSSSSRARRIKRPRR